jgi:hypothetical protein
VCSGFQNPPASCQLSKPEQREKWDFHSDTPGGTPGQLAGETPALRMRVAALLTFQSMGENDDAPDQAVVVRVSASTKT